MIEKAHYTCSTKKGTNSPADLKIVKELCEEQRSECVVTANRDTFGNTSCPTSNITDMNLMVTYLCMGGRKEGHEEEIEGGDLCLGLAPKKQKCNPICGGGAKCLQRNGVYNCYCPKGFRYTDGECQNMTETSPKNTSDPMDISQCPEGFFYQHGMFTNALENFNVTNS